MKTKQKFITPVGRARRNYADACRMRDNAQAAYEAEPTTARETALKSARDFAVRMLHRQDIAEQS